MVEVRVVWVQRLVPNLAAAYKECDPRDEEKMEDDDADDRGL